MRMASWRLAVWAAIGVFLIGCHTPAPKPAAAPPAEAVALKGVDKIKADAANLRPLVQSELTRRFLDAAENLPRIEPRTLYVNKEKRQWFTKVQADALPEAERAALTERPVDEDLYYNTKYGTPLAYARPLDLIAQADVKPRFSEFARKRILDYGYGTVGHLRVLAGLRADVVGVDVDPFLPALYSEPTDQGDIRLGPGAPVAGTIKLVNGRWPAEADAKAAVGSGFDLIISKNTLKNGYLHPSRPVDKRLLVDLGVSEEEFVRALHDSLKPGGLLMIYNLSPAESKDDEPYKPWADGRTPFPKEMFEKAGFVVIAYDINDDAAARAMAHALGWDARGEGAMDLEHDLFAHYTIAQRPQEARP